MLGGTVARHGRCLRGMVAAGGLSVERGRAAHREGSGEPAAAAAARQGLVLRKSRRRDPRAYDFGRYWLLDASLTMIVAGGQFGMNLDEVEGYLKEYSAS